MLDIPMEISRRAHPLRTAYRLASPERALGLTVFTVVLSTTACVADGPPDEGAASETSDAPDPPDVRDFDNWHPMSVGGSPVVQAFVLPVGVWTGSEMLVWTNGEGGRYSPEDDRWRPIAFQAELAARDGASAVWAGDQLILWGGDDPGYVRADTGARYYPTTDTWVSMSSDGAPSPRTAHTAVWTGAEMIVWGGFGPSPDGTSEDDPSIALVTGGMYDPVADRWRPMSEAGAPIATQDPLAVWTGNELIVIGGEDGARYDPSADRWEPISTQGMPQPGFLFLHHAVWTGSEVLFGLRAAYDPSTDRWRDLAGNGSVRAREGYSLVWTGQQAILWGGADAQYEYRNTGIIYDPATGEWQDTPNTLAPSPRRNHVAVWTGEEMIVWGGSVLYAYDDPDHETQAFNDGGRLGE
jgi:hypothetical protein